MAERLNQIANHATASKEAGIPHPLDPLSVFELTTVVSIVRDTFKGHSISFNTVTLHEPDKSAFKFWKETGSKIPDRKAYFIVLDDSLSTGFFEGVVNITTKSIEECNQTSGACPIITTDDLRTIEETIRNDPKVIKQCELSGVPKSEMHKVYCDPWTIGYDERFGTSKRLQQALMYYRSDEDDSQYSHPLDFCPIVDSTKKEVVAIDIPSVRRPVSKHKHANFNLKDVGPLREVKPIAVTQPQGVNFSMDGRYIEWQNFKFHIGFNYREGLVLSDIFYNDKGTPRSIFYRLSLAEMVVPYGEPSFPHQRKHAFDLGEYGAGNMTNPLSLGCDCKGVIHYLDFDFVERDGNVATVKNAVCIHEEDDGVLFKHSDFRDDFQTTIVTRGIRLVISHIFTAANYEYMVYYIFHMDGTIQLEIKLTGILNTYICDEDDDLKGYGTQVYPKVNAHNHQHLFCLRINPEIDGPGNSFAVVDGAQSTAPVGSADNFYGNAFYAARTVPKTTGEAQYGYDGPRCRTYDMFNPNRIHPYSKKPATYKLVSREVPMLLPKPGSLVWKRAGFARNAIHVTPYVDRQFYPAGNHVPQTSGEPSRGLPEWIGDGKAGVENTDIVVWHTFGITHFPAPEDFPIMPAEPINLLLRPRNFFLKNPALDVPASFNVTTSDVKANKAGSHAMKDSTSALAFGKTSGEAAMVGSCCSSNKTSAAEPVSLGCGCSCNSKKNGCATACKCSPGQCCCA
ncbi:hypothetical protein CANCADRAFT_45945 [Tortispora caseinolytica NRRL Y-17796]|uniref:Amine oxidase n=1 Tax=Tortispora caseinolytica NRRL Y-17796 TaxID=767744 RepID=A0A1E4TD01_9ASCO|nr:hypothetical protein CANCADRAFT_45945 [Tortispora caseinolytica NRRL Y-17796]